jgi:RNA polymerase sigma-70 factor (ECF subfamily)
MEYTVQSDVVDRAQRGNPEATGALYTRYHQNIYRFLYYRTGDPQIAEDLTSDVFLKMVQALPSYRLDSTPFQAWLFQIARNLAIDHYRRATTHPVAFLSENLNSLEMDLDSTIEFNLTCRGLADALARLDENQRDVVLLRFIQGMPIAEAASVLHKSEDAIKALQRRGLAALRVMLNHNEDNHDKPG